MSTTSTSAFSSSSWLTYLQFLDSALPIGGFSHSFGLESAVQAGRVNTIDDLRQYALTLLYYSWAPADLSAIKAVYLFAPSKDWLSIWQVDRLLHIQRAAMESREGAQKMGRRMLNLAQSIHPKLEWGPLNLAVKEGRCFAILPTVHGWVSLQLGVTLTQAVEGYLYSCLTNCINSALRLMNIGQTQTQSLLAELLPHIGIAWERFAEVDPFQCHSNTPAAEIYMMQHEALYSRLFMS